MMDDAQNADKGYRFILQEEEALARCLYRQETSNLTIIDLADKDSEARVRRWKLRLCAKGFWPGYSEIFWSICSENDLISLIDQRAPAELEKIDTGVRELTHHKFFCCLEGKDVHVEKLVLIDSRHHIKSLYGHLTLDQSLAHIFWHEIGHAVTKKTVEEVLKISTLRWEMEADGFAALHMLVRELLTSEELAKIADNRLLLALVENDLDHFTTNAIYEAVIAHAMNKASLSSASIKDKAISEAEKRAPSPLAISLMKAALRQPEASLSDVFERAAEDLAYAIHDPWLGGELRDTTMMKCLSAQARVLAPTSKKL